MVHLYFPPASRAGNKRQVLLYFIPGNPGLIRYYDPFLQSLRSLLDSSVSDEEVSFHLYGRDLAGFDDDDHAPFSDTNPPHDVESQIQQTSKHMRSSHDELGPQTPGGRFHAVVLVGHSVGAYIALEVFDRHARQDKQPGVPLTLTHPLPLPSPRLHAGVLLFPAVTHIARSPSGRRAELLRRRLPPVWAHGHTLARAFLWAWPDAALRWVLRRLLGFAPHAVAATLALLRSRDGVWQGLHLGKDEMRVITEERWAEELWEVHRRDMEGDGHADADTVADVTKFYFFFGKKDHWVADECRAEFIEKRRAHAERDGPKRGSTRVVVDEGDLPHAFCINHSETMAEKVKVWVDEIAAHV